MNSVKTAFSIENVSVAYGKAQALKGISLTIAESSVTSIIGLNGSGKSTLLKALASCVKLQEGKITVFDKDDDKKELSRKKTSLLISYLPQYRPIPDCSVEQLLLYGRFPHKSFLRSYSNEDRAFVERVLSENNLLRFAKMPLSALSGGQRQKAYIAMALCQDTKILLLDEPLTFLDIKEQFEILSLLRSVAKTKGKTVVMVSHNLDFSLTFSSAIILLDKGRLSYHGSAEGAKEYIESVFRVRAHKVLLSDSSLHYVFTPLPPRP